MSPDTDVQEQSGASTMSKHAQEAFQQGNIVRLPTNPRGNNNNEPPPKSPVIGPGRSPCSEDHDYDFGCDYKLDGTASPNRPGCTYAGAPMPAALLQANSVPTNSDNNNTQIHKQIQAEIRAFMLEEDMKSEADLRAHVFEQVMPELQWAASEAAKREVGRLMIAEKKGIKIKAETEDEKIAAVVSCLRELSSRSLETLFRKRDVVDLLKRVLERLDRKVDDDGWGVFNAQ